MVGTGSHRLDKDRDGHYDQADAVRIMDAWDKTMPAAVFKPKMGDALFKRYDEHLSPDLPNSFHGDGHDHLGSAWEVGWFGPLNKDLRTVVRPKKVRGKWHVKWCGGGKLSRCRAALLSSLREALAMDPAKLYEDPTLAGEDCGVMDSAGVLRRAALQAAGGRDAADDPVAEPADAAAGGGGDVAPGAVDVSESRALGCPV